MQCMGSMVVNEPFVRTRTRAAGATAGRRRLVLVHPSIEGGVKTDLAIPGANHGLTPGVRFAPAPRSVEEIFGKRPSSAVALRKCAPLQRPTYSSVACEIEVISMFLVKMLEPSFYRDLLGHPFIRYSEGA